MIPHFKNVRRYYGSLQMSFTYTIVCAGLHLSAKTRNAGYIAGLLNENDELMPLGALLINEPIPNFRPPPMVLLRLSSQCMFATMQEIDIVLNEL